VAFHRFDQGDFQALGDLCRDVIHLLASQFVDVCGRHRHHALDADVDDGAAGKWSHHHRSGDALSGEILERAERTGSTILGLAVQHARMEDDDRAVEEDERRRLARGLDQQR
jgi:hypothetical protein